MCKWMYLKQRARPICQVFHPKCDFPHHTYFLISLMYIAMKRITIYVRIKCMSATEYPEDIICLARGCFLQGVPTQVKGLAQPLVLSYIYMDRFQNPFGHLTTILGDLIEHIKHLGTCSFTWETWGIRPRPY